MATEPVIELDGVRFGYGGGGGGFALRVERLRVGAGRLVACIGPSGSGKTTLINLIAGILVPSAGVVRVLGRTVSALAEPGRRRHRLERIGMVFQEFELLEYLTAWENITLSLRLAGAGDAGALRSRARALAGAAGIEHCLGRKPRALSQGERQRVGLCRALAGEPKLLLCDEPTGNLDPEATGSVLDLLLGQARATGAAVVMVTHNHALLTRFDEVIDMRTLGAAAPQEVGR